MRCWSSQDPHWQAAARRQVIASTTSSTVRSGAPLRRPTPGRAARLLPGRQPPAGGDLAQRLLRLDVALADLLARHRPDAVAVERVFSQHNVRTVMGTAQAGAVAVLAAARAGLPVQTYTPSEVKAAVTGSGQADK